MYDRDCHSATLISSLTGPLKPVLLTFPHSAMTFEYALFYVFVWQVVNKRRTTISGIISLTIGHTPLPIGYCLKTDSNFIGKFQLCHIVVLTKFCDFSSYLLHIKHNISFLHCTSSCCIPASSLYQQQFCKEASGS